MHYKLFQVVKRVYGDDHIVLETEDQKEAVECFEEEAHVYRGSSKIKIRLRAQKHCENWVRLNLREE